MVGKFDYLLSIIIPTYNNAEFITTTLSSVQQGLTHEVEVIIINDGSTDNTYQKVCDFYQHIPSDNIKIINQANQGVAITRNVGLENATGKYIAFIDSDDLVSPHYFDVLLPILREKEYDMIEFDLTRDMTQLYLLPQGGHPDSSNREINLANDPLTPLMATFQAAQWHLMTRIFRREMIGHDRFEAHRRYEDMIFCPFQYFKCTRILKVNANLYYYRINGASITENLQEIDAQHIFFAMKKMCNYIKKHPERRTVATLMIVNCFLEGRKIIRKTKGYYAYDNGMLDDIKEALSVCDMHVISKKTACKMKYTFVDKVISATRYYLLMGRKSSKSRERKAR